MGDTILVLNTLAQQRKSGKFPNSLYFEDEINSNIAVHKHSKSSLTEKKYKTFGRFGSPHHIDKRSDGGIMSLIMKHVCHKRPWVCRDVPQNGNRPQIADM